eukprot:m51a1_g710 hypothetical protein (490) ;mRNA; f:407009-408851
MLYPRRTARALPWRPFCQFVAVCCVVSAAWTYALGTISSAGSAQPNGTQRGLAPPFSRRLAQGDDASLPAQSARHVLRLPETPRADPPRPRALPTGHAEHIDVPRLPRPLTAAPLFNPSPAVPWPALDSVPLARRHEQRNRQMFVFFRWTGPPPVSRSVVLVRRYDLSSTVEEGGGVPARLGSLKAGPFVAINETSGAACDGKEPCGMEDARGIVWGGNLVVVANARNGIDGLRGMVLSYFRLEDVSRASYAHGTGGWMRPWNMTWLFPPVDWPHEEQRRWQKNWMPFVADSGRLNFIHGIEPHTIIECETPGSGACRQASKDSWPELPRVIGATGDLRGSTAVVDRGPDVDFLTCGHWQLPRSKGVRCCQYKFFCYTFQRRPPYAVTAISRPFSLGDIDPNADPSDVNNTMQYLSGITLVGDHYVLTYSTGDRSSQTVTFERDVFDALVGHHKRPHAPAQDPLVPLVQPEKPQRKRKSIFGFLGSFFF